MARQTDAGEESGADITDTVIADQFRDSKFTIAVGRLGFVFIVRNPSLPIWARAMTSVFLSYARNDDEPFVARLYRDLTAAGFDVWFDRVSIPQ